MIQCRAPAPAPGPVPLLGLLANLALAGTAKGLPLTR